MTIDWPAWMSASAEQQEAMWRRYRAIVRAESDEARANNYARMDRAMAEAARLTRV